MKLWDKIKLWYINNFVLHITLCAATEHCYISKALWHRIIKRIPSEKRKELKVFFEKYPITVYPGNGCPTTYLYRFFVNTDLKDIRTPDGEEPFTVQIQFGRYGHLGFQSVQPTPVEILTNYGIADMEFIDFHLADHVRLKVSESMVNGEYCYDILPVVVGEAFRPNTEAEPDPKDLIDLTDIDDD